MLTTKAETCGKTLEEMDVVFGAVSAEQRKRDIEAVQASSHFAGHGAAHETVSEDSSSDKGGSRHVERA